MVSITLKLIDTLDNSNKSERKRKPTLVSTL